MIETTARVIHDGMVNAVMSFTGRADAQGGSETLAVKVDASELSPPAAPKVRKITYTVNGGSVHLLWDDPNDNVPFAVLSGQGEFCYERIGGMPNGAPDPTGDILLSTIDFVPGSNYTILLEMRK